MITKTLITVRDHFEFLVEYLYDDQNRLQDINSLFNHPLYIITDRELFEEIYEQLVDVFAQ